MAITKLPHEIQSLILSKTAYPYKYKNICSSFFKAGATGCELKINEILQKYPHLISTYQDIQKNNQNSISQLNHLYQADLIPKI